MTVRIVLAITMLLLLTAASRAGAGIISVNWAYTDHVTNVAGLLSKNEAVTGWTAGAASSNGLAAGANGYVESTAVETNLFRMFGFSDAAISSPYVSTFATIDYALYLKDYGVLAVFESGISRGDIGSYQYGDVLRVERVGSTVMYKRNGSSLYTSTIASAGALHVEAAFYNNGATIKNARLGAIAVPEPASIVLLGCGGLALIRRRSA